MAAADQITSTKMKHLCVGFKWLHYVWTIALGNRKERRGLTGRGRRTVCTISQSGQRVRTAAEAAAAYYVRRHVALPLGPDTVIDRVFQSQFPVHALLSPVHCTPSPLPLTWPPRCTCVECVLARRIGSSFAYAAYTKCMKRVSEIDEIDIKCVQGG